MSTQAIHRFFDTVMSDPDLRSEIGEAVEGSEDPASVTAAIAADQGFEFTSEELTRIIHAAGSTSDELSLEDLESLAGGVSSLDLDTVALGQSVLKKIRFAPPYVPVGPEE